MDGTIADTFTLCTTSLRSTVEALTDTTKTNDEISAQFGLSEEGILNELVPGKAAEGLEIYHRFYEKLHPALCAKPVDGIIDLIMKIKKLGINVALVTGKGDRALAITLRLFGMEDTFEPIETGKPNNICKADGITSVLGKLNLQPEEAVYIGDTAGDIAGSRKAGVQILSAAWAESADIAELEKNNLGSVFYSVEEMASFLDSLLLV